MRKRHVPSTLMFLAALVLLAIAAAGIGGVTLYLQNRGQTQARAEAITGGKVANGPALMAGYGCGSCHIIPGITGANGKVGPDLSGISKRTTIAGSLPNDPKTMILWLQHPQALRPGSGMPEMGVTDAAARDIAAYLYARS
ncbi:c-type cytochrome [Sphingomonas crusticola]|uniref:c-type cytochrome n=1 Tax=Sphingomonas crusticola TaxID=1697973 RepID=UPI001F082584|nr:c-type cytochrome [Sphingomonas crusticola]